MCDVWKCSWRLAESYIHTYIVCRKQYPNIRRRYEHAKYVCFVAYNTVRACHLARRDSFVVVRSIELPNPTPHQLSNVSGEERKYQSRFFWNISDAGFKFVLRSDLGQNLIHTAHRSLVSLTHSRLTKML